MVDETVAKFGAPHVLYNNAGITRRLVPGARRIERVPHNIVQCASRL